MRHSTCDCPVSDALGRAVHGLCGRKRPVRSRAELCQEKYVTQSLGSRETPSHAVLRGRYSDRTSAICLHLVFSEHSIIARINTIYIRVSINIQRPVPADERAWLGRGICGQACIATTRGSMQALLGLCFSSTHPILTHTKTLLSPLNIPRRHEHGMCLDTYR